MYQEAAPLQAANHRLKWRSAFEYPLEPPTRLCNVFDCTDQMLLFCAIAM